MPAFFADCNVGKLAKWLRMLGYDVLYERAISDDVLVCRALREGRVILTRDTGISTRRDLLSPPNPGSSPQPRCVFITSDDTIQQVRQVISAMGLRGMVGKLPPRCALCNGVLVDVPKESVAGVVPPYTFGVQERFRRCAECGRVYWHGTHMERVLREALGPLADGHTGIPRRRAR